MKKKSKQKSVESQNTFKQENTNVINKNQTDIPQTEDPEGDQSNTSGSGLLRKRRINGGVRSKKNKLINH